MGKLLSRYKELVDGDTLDAIRKLSAQLEGKSVLHIYSGRLQGDVAEKLSYLAALYVDVGLQFQANTMVGTEDLLDLVSLSEQGAASGSGGALPQRWVTSYEDALRENGRKMFLSSDLVVVQGVQPVGLIEHRRGDCPWLWRCHADLTGVAAPLWSFVDRFVSQYQGALFSHTSFVPEMRVPYFVVPPSTDPFAPVNQEMSASEIGTVLAELKIPGDRPLAVQFLSVGSSEEALRAVKAWKARRSGEAILVLVQVDPGRAGRGILSVSEAAAVEAVDQSVRLVRLGRDSTRKLCALGWAARVVVDCSTSRWPNLYLLDVMWKGTPVVVAAGSTNSAFVSEQAGFNVRSGDELSRRLDELLDDPKMARSKGAAAHRAIVERHLLPRHLLDYLKLLLYFEKDQG